MNDPNLPAKPGLLRAILDAIHGEDERLAGVAVSRLRTPLTAEETATLNVESTLNFSEYTDGMPGALVIVGGEIAQSTGRTDTSFTGLTRGLFGGQVRFHPQGSLVYDFGQNRSAVDHIRRGFLVAFAREEDLDVIGRNLGVDKCFGLTEDQWREIIQRVAYMPRQPIDSFRQVLDVIFPGQYEIIKKISEPYVVRVNVEPQLSTELRGKFFLNGGERQLTTGLATVVVNFPINHVVQVVDDTPLTRRGWRGPTFTNYFAGGSFLGQTITLGSSPGPIGTPMIVDYGAFKAHYLAMDEDVEQDADFYAYFSDDGALTRCLLDLVRAAGIHIKVGLKV